MMFKAKVKGHAKLLDTHLLSVLVKGGKEEGRTERNIYILLLVLQSPMH